MRWFWGKYSNCLIFALKMFWKHGGYIIMRKSQHTWFPHFMWAENIDHVEVREYKPIKPSTNRFLRAVPLHTIVFRGRIREGRGEERRHASDRRAVPRD